MASSNARVESSVVPAHHAEERRMWVGLSKALPAARPARRGHGLPQSRASLGPGRVCWMFMDWGSGRKCELESCFHLFYFYASFNKPAGISHLSQRQMRKPKPRLGFRQFRVQLCWRGGEDKGTLTHCQRQRSFQTGFWQCL